MNTYRATYRHDRHNESPGWFTMTFANTNYELARDHARTCGKTQGLVYCTIERLPREAGQKELSDFGGRFIDVSAPKRVAA